MSDHYAPPSRPQVLLRSLDRQQPRPRSVRLGGAPAAGACRCGEDAGRGRRLGREPPRQRPGAHRRHARRTRSHRQGVQAGVRGQRHRRADGHREALLRPGLPRRRLHGQRPGRARLRAAEDDARDGHRRGAGREDLRVLGRPRGHRDRRLPTRGRRGEAAAACDRLPVRVLDRQEVRLQVRDRGQAERAARPHLLGDDRQLPGPHSRRWHTPSCSA